jgi:16S rRNA (uracil1498-N3)-methyltransferase
MHRIYSPSKNISGDTITLDDKDQVHHARDVLRLKIDEEVVIFDDAGNEYSAILQKLSPQAIIFRIKNKRHPMPKLNKVKITVACAIPKASHMDGVVDKLTQIGVDTIVPLETERVIVKLYKHKKVSRLTRWKKIALNASQQSQRNTLPVLEPITDIEKLLSNSKSFDLKLIPTLEGERRPLKEVLSVNKPKNILVLIGPEGDFTKNEVDLAIKAGFVPITLGETVLRVETAAVCVASFIKFYFDPPVDVQGNPGDFKGAKGL